MELKEFIKQSLIQINSAIEESNDELKNSPRVAITSTNNNIPGYEEGLVSLEYQLARAQHEEQLLLTEFNKQKADFEKLFAIAQSLDKENLALQRKRDLFLAVQQRKDQKDMERNVPGSIDVLMRAFASSKPYNDRRIVFTAMTLAMALGMGSGVAFLKASRNQAIYTHEDMPYPMQVPFLGYIPAIRTKRSTDDEKRYSLKQKIAELNRRIMDCKRIWERYSPP